MAKKNWFEFHISFSIEYTAPIHWLAWAGILMNKTEDYSCWCETCYRLMSPFQSYFVSDLLSFSSILTLYREREREPPRRIVVLLHLQVNLNILYSETDIAPTIRGTLKTKLLPPLLLMSHRGSSSGY